MTGSLKLVIGASGFLGSHVTRRLVAQGHRVRVMLRRTSSTRGIDDLDVERRHGDLHDDAALRSAMAGCDVVFHCALDARFWLRDPAPLFRTNVDGLRHVLEAAVAADLDRFVYTSSVGTLAARSDGVPVTEAEPHNWDGGAYIASRLGGEKLLFEYSRERGLPGIAMCISTTYGPGDWGPTPHGRLIGEVARGRFPGYFDWSLEAVGIEEAARAMVLAAEHGRVGERYAISDRFISCREIHEIVCAAAGRPRPWLRLPRSLMVATTQANDVAAALLRRDLPMTRLSQHITDTMSPLDHSKAERELGWTPEPIEESLVRAAHFFTEKRLVAMARPTAQKAR